MNADTELNQIAPKFFEALTGYIKNAVNEASKQAFANRQREESFLSINDIVKKYKISRATVYQWRVKGLLKYRTINGKKVFIKESDIVSLLDAKGQNNTAE